MKTGTAPYSSFSLLVKSCDSSPETSIPGQPYHWKVVVFERPLRPVTRPPEDMEKSNLPSCVRLIVMGRRFETSKSLDSSLGGSLTAGILRVVAMSDQRSAVVKNVE